MDAARPRTVFQRLGDESDERWIFTPNLVWIERRDSTIVEERSDPRAAFAGHVRETPWDRLHLTYFLGYAVWNYLTAPFLFARAGFAARELEAHVECRETWRVLEVTYPDDVPARARKAPATPDGRVAREPERLRGGQLRAGRTAAGIVTSVCPSGDLRVGNPAVVVVDQIVDIAGV